MSPTSVLFVCTGNLCRSPSAAWFLTGRLRGTVDGVTVRSAGTMQASGHPPEEMLVEGGEAYAQGLRDHTPRRMSPADVAGADLILGMTREHAREAVLIEKSAFARAFTLREFVRRASAAGGRPAGCALDQWLSVVNGDRRHLSLVGESTDDDIADPIGGPPEGYRAMLVEVQTLTDALYELVWGASVTPRQSG